jgi:hypothetical protein
MLVSERERVRVFAANRKELWVSMAVVVCAGLLQVVPIGFKGALLLAGSMVVGLVCAINAFTDRDEMGVVETYVAGVWLIAMVILTPLTFYWLVTIHEFANR